MFTLEEAYKAIARLEHYIQRKLSEDKMEDVLGMLLNSTFPSCNPVDLVQFSGFLTKEINHKAIGASAPR